MAYDSVWVACLVAGTAVTISWVTSRGSLRAAREQARAAALVQRGSWLAQARRDSYPDVVNRAHDMGALYQKLPSVLAMSAGEAKRAAVEEHAERLSEAYGPFARACDVAVVDGGSSVAAAVQDVFRHSRSIYRCLLDSATSGDARTAFNVAVDLYWRSVEALVWAMHQEAGPEAT
ncbi:hypothetical protein ACKI1Q_39455 [Streptomyces galilaeus]|uniref:hypothetical protein n=1 Tax=Streptomyces galilaeus TaxID=33899 RepID=UPI0038F7DEB5